MEAAMDAAAVAPRSAGYIVPGEQAVLQSLVDQLACTRNKIFETVAGAEPIRRMLSRWHSG